MTWHIHLYEPAIDPGGAEEIFLSDKPTKDEAVADAMTQAQAKYPYVGWELFCLWVEDEKPEPYLLQDVVITYRLWNPKFEPQALCGCGHPYERHFDGYEGNAAIGCKYCMCELWHEPESALNPLLLGTRPLFPERNW